MVGRDVLLEVEKTPPPPGRPLLVVKDLVVLDNRQLEAVRGISLSVRAGEIVGIAGVDGNGQTELVEALTGLRRPRSGRSSSTTSISPVAGPGPFSTPASATFPRTGSGRASC